MTTTDAREREFAQTSFAPGRRLANSRPHSCMRDITFHIHERSVTIEQSRKRSRAAKRHYFLPQI